MNLVALVVTRYVGDLDVGVDWRNEVASGAVADANF